MTCEDHGGGEGERDREEVWTVVSGVRRVSRGCGMMSWVVAKMMMAE